MAASAARRAVEEVKDRALQARTQTVVKRLARDDLDIPKERYKLVGEDMVDCGYRFGLLRHKSFPKKERIPI